MIVEQIVNPFQTSVRNNVLLILMAIVIIGMIVVLTKDIRLENNPK